MINIDNTNGVFIIDYDHYRYATKGTVVIYEDSQGSFQLTFDSQNVSFKQADVGLINGQPVVNLFNQLCAIIT